MVYLFLAEESSHGGGCSFWVNHGIWYPSFWLKSHPTVGVAVVGGIWYTFWLKSHPTVGVAVVGLTTWYMVYLFLAEESSHGRGCCFWVNHMVYGIPLFG